MACLQRCQQRIARQALVPAEAARAGEPDENFFHKDRASIRATSCPTRPQRDSDIRMRIISGKRRYPFVSRRDDLVPLAQIFVWPAIKVGEQEIGITAIRPERIEEHHDRIDLLCIRVDIVDLDAVVEGCIPAAKFLRVSDNAQTSLASAARCNVIERRWREVSDGQTWRTQARERATGDQSQTSCLVAIDKQHPTMGSLQSHVRGVEVIGQCVRSSPRNRAGWTCAAAMISSKPPLLWPPRKECTWATPLYSTKLELLVLLTTRWEFSC